MVPYENLPKAAQALLSHVYNEHRGDLRYSVRALALALRGHALSGAEASAAIEAGLATGWFRRDSASKDGDMYVSLSPEAEAQLFISIRPKPAERGFVLRAPIKAAMPAKPAPVPLMPGPPGNGNAPAGGKAVRAR